jgi:CBS domain-containing protein
MKCWFCDAENIQGSDLCEQCGEDLTKPVYDRFHDPIERDLLRRRLVDLMNSEIVEVPSSTTVREVLGRITETGKYCALVVDGGRLVGILTERDVLLKLADDFGRCADRPVKDFMTADPESLSYDAPVAFALNRMMVGGYRHIPILRDDKPAGLVSVRDILAYLVQRLPGTITENAGT